MSGKTIRLHLYKHLFSYSGIYVIPALTCSRSPIKYHSFGRLDTHLLIVLRVSQGQLYRLLHVQEQVEKITTITVTQSYALLEF